MATQIDLGKVVPEKGIDYFTQADKTEVQTAVETNIAPELAEKELKANKTSTIDENSTEDQYPEAPAVYNKLVEQDEKIAELEEQNAMLIGQIPTATATGETIHVEDSSNLPPKDFAILGNATQDGTTGKNILDIANHFEARPAGGGYATYKLNDNNGIELVSGSTGWGLIYNNCQVKLSLQAGTYTVSLTNSSIEKAVIKDDGTQLSATFTISETTNIGIGVKPNASTGPAYIMLQTGSTATTYEPYTGGKASPNPDYPQNVNVATGNNTAKIVGKNLFDIGIVSNYSGNSVVTEISNNTLSFDIKGSGGTFSFNTINKYFGNTTYTLTATASKTYSRFFIRLRNFEDTGWATNSDYTITGWSYNSYYGGWYKDNASTTANVTITIPNCLYWQIGLGYSNNSVTTGDTETISNVQIELGSTATTYEPYTEQTQLLSNLPELAKIGNYTDRIFKSSGKWYVEKNIGKVTLDGTQTIGNPLTYGDNKRFPITPTNYTNEIIYKASPTNCKCNLIGCSYIGVVQDADTATDMLMYCHSSAILITVTPSYNISTAEDLRTWLSTHNAIVYFTSKPTYTEITDTTLISQLENILAMHTNKNVTNAWIEPTGTNAQASLTLTYYQDLETLLNDYETRIEFLETE